MKGEGWRAEAGERWLASLKPSLYELGGENVSLDFMYYGRYADSNFKYRDRKSVV